MQTEIHKIFILVVDEDSGMRQSIKSALEELKGVEILESDCNKSAADIFLNQRVRAIITDITKPGKPGLDGMAFVSSVRETDSNIPVIFISDSPDKDLVISALKLGAFDFIEKPFEDNVLLGTIKRALTTIKESFVPRLQSFNLNSTQIKILERVMRGMTNKEIAESVNLSEQGVKYHIGNLFRKFGASDRCQLRTTVWKLADNQPLEP